VAAWPLKRVHQWPYPAMSFVGRAALHLGEPLSNGVIIKVDKNPSPNCSSRATSPHPAQRRAAYGD